MKKYIETGQNALEHLHEVTGFYDNHAIRVGVEQPEESFEVGSFADRVSAADESIEIIEAALARVRLANS